MNTRNTSGFTLIEMMVTVVVAGIFIGSLAALYGAIVDSSTSNRNFAIANDVAYSYLRNYASAGSEPTWFTCSTATGTSNTNDLSVNANAPGQTLSSGTITNNQPLLPAPVTYSVVAVAPYGCSGAQLHSPIRVTATVKYGSPARAIQHSTYVGRQ